MTIDIFEHNELNEGKLYQKIFTYTSIVVLIIILNIIILFGIRKKIYYQHYLLFLKDKRVQCLKDTRKDCWQQRSATWESGSATTL